MARAGYGSRRSCEDLIRQGRTTKEIAHLLGITPRGVTFHRTNIRIKAGIHKQGGNLKTILDTM